MIVDGGSSHAIVGMCHLCVVNNGQVLEYHHDNQSSSIVVLVIIDSALLEFVQ